MIARETILSFMTAASLSAAVAAVILTAGVTHDAYNRRPLEQYNLQLAVALCVSIELVAIETFRRVETEWRWGVATIVVLPGAVLLVGILALDFFLGELGLKPAALDLLGLVIVGAVALEIVLFRVLLRVFERHNFGRTRLGAALLAGVAAAPLLAFALLPFGKFGGEL